MNSSSFAAIARDINTLKYLFKENKINYDTLAKEYLCPEFNEILVQQPKSINVKNALLRGIHVFFYTGNHNELERMIAHYQKTYITVEEQNELKECLRKSLAEPPTKQLVLMKKEADCSKLLLAFDQFNFVQDPDLQTNYYHLKLLTLLKKTVSASDITLFLNQLSTEQIKMQIRCATIANQHHVLDMLLAHLKISTIDPKSCASIFNKEVIDTVNATTLAKASPKIKQLVLETRNSEPITR